ncbi:MAG: hypothetical protein WAP55_02460 [Minisyncoccia bacterium]
MSYNKNILENLFGAKARVLKLFFQRPTLTLSVLDIGKKTGLKNRAIKPVIGDLVRLGILKKINGNGKKKKNKIK